MWHHRCESHNIYLYMQLSNNTRDRIEKAAYFLWCSPYKHLNYASFLYSAAFKFQKKHIRNRRGRWVPDYTVVSQKSMALNVDGYYTIVRPCRSRLQTHRPSSRCHMIQCDCKQIQLKSEKCPYSDTSYPFNLVICVRFYDTYR